MLANLKGKVEASRKELVVQMTRGGFSVDSMRGVLFEQMLRLRTLNRYSARLPALVGASSVSPFQMYMELRELLGELAALQPDRDPFEVGRYTHDNPAVVFNELSSKISALLRGAVAASFTKVEFTPEENYLVASLSEENLTKPNEYYLGITSNEDPRALSKLVEDGDRFKVMAQTPADAGSPIEWSAGV